MTTAISAGLRQKLPHRIQHMRLHTHVAMNVALTSQAITRIDLFTRQMLCLTAHDRGNDLRMIALNDLHRTTAAQTKTTAIENFIHAIVKLNFFFFGCRADIDARIDRNRFVFIDKFDCWHKTPLEAS